MFLTGTSSIDYIHVVILLFLVVFLCLPRLRRSTWSILVTYLSIVVVILYLWMIFAADITGITPPARPFNEICDMIGIKVQSTPLYTGKYPWLLLLLCLSTAHAPFERETRWTWEMNRSKSLENLHDGIRIFFFKHGLWFAYALYLLVGLSPPIEITKLLHLCFLVALLVAHLRSMKPSSSSRKALTHR